MNPLPSKNELPEKIKQAHQKLLSNELAIEDLKSQMNAKELLVANDVACEKDVTGKNKFTNENIRAAEVAKRLNDDIEMDSMTNSLSDLTASNIDYIVEYEYLKNCLRVLTNSQNE